MIDEIDSQMQKIKYGWLDKKGDRHEDLDGFGEEYVLKMLEQLLRSKLGVCWGQVELERKLFAEKKIKTNIYSAPSKNLSCLEFYTY